MGKIYCRIANECSKKLLQSVPVCDRIDSQKRTYVLIGSFMGIDLTIE